MKPEQLLMKNKNGFTFIETMIVVGIVTLLATSVIVLVNPAKRFEDARDKQREIHLQTILSAIEQKRSLEGGWSGVDCESLPFATSTPPGEEEEEEDMIPAFKTIGTRAEEDPENFYDLFPCLVPKYMPNPLYDPEGGNATDTHYQIWQNPQTKYVTVCYEKEQPHYKRFCAGAETYRILSEPKDVVTKLILEPDIGHYTAIGGGTVYDDGGAYVSEAGVIWAEAAKFNNSIVEAEAGMKYDSVDMNEILRTADAEGTADFSFTSNIHSLQAGVIKYYARAYAKNEIGVGYGMVEEFDTLDGRPHVDTVDPADEDIGYDVATIRGVIQTLGVEIVGRAFFCWDSDNTFDGEQVGGCTNYTNEGWNDIDYEPFSFFTTIGPLSVDEEYWFQACGENSVGPRCGLKKSFIATSSAPFVETLEVNAEDVEAYSAWVGGEVVSNGGSLITERGVCFSNSDPIPCYNPADYPDQCEVATQIDGEIGNFFTTITVEPGYDYVVCAYASNNKGLSHGNPSAPFHVAPTVPRVTTKTEGEMVIGNSWVVSGGDITSDGGGSINNHGVCWSDSQDPKNFVLDPLYDSHCVDNGSGIMGGFTSDIDPYESGLWGDTPYYVRAYAINEVDIGWGEEVDPVIFTTAGAGDPELYTTYPPDDITITSAVLGGRVDDHGGASIKHLTNSNLQVCWSVSNTDPQINGEDVNCQQVLLPILDNLGPFTVEVGGLIPNTIYYYQAYARNEEDHHNYGGAENFRTLAIQPPIVETVHVASSSLDWVIITGDVTSGGYLDTVRGICYYDGISTECTFGENGTGTFAVTIGGLGMEPLYYYSAYAFAYNLHTPGEIEYGQPIAFELSTCKEWFAGDHQNIPDTTDPREECSQFWSGCDSTCLRTGQPGYCYAGECMATTTSPVRSGYVCTGQGLETGVDANYNCGTDAVCASGACTGSIYFISCSDEAGSEGTCRDVTDHEDALMDYFYAEAGKVLYSNCTEGSASSFIKCGSTRYNRATDKCSCEKKYPACSDTLGDCDDLAEQYYTSTTVNANTNSTLTTICGNAGVGNCGDDSCKWCQGGSCNFAFVDTRPSPDKTYNTVKVGTQCWMQQNMDIGLRVNGNVSQGTGCATPLSIEKYCYGDISENCYYNEHPTYPDGALYRWDQAMCGATYEGARGICPIGWHIPKDSEWGSLVSNAVNGCVDAMVYGWNCPGAGTNLKPGGNTDFNANLAGNVYSSGTFHERNTDGYYWSSTLYSETSVWIRHFVAPPDIYASEVQKIYRYRAYGYSVRCIKN